MAHLTTLIADSGGWGQRIMVGWALLLILAVALGLLVTGLLRGNDRQDGSQEASEPLDGR